MGVGEGTGVVWGRVLNNSFDNHSAVPFLGNPGTARGGGGGTVQKSDYVSSNQ